MGASEGTTEAVAEHTYQGTTTTLQQARHDVIALLKRQGHGSIADDAELVVSELTSNAVDASPDKPYRVAVQIGCGEVSIAVTNRSTARIPAEESWGPENVLAPQGRGLAIVRALSDRVEVESTDHEITITAFLKLAR